MAENQNIQVVLNSYDGGLNKDLSKFKYPRNKYYDASNIRIITHSGLSSGSVTNTKGTKLDFVVPDLPSLTYVEPDSTSVVIPELTNLKIIGGTYYNNRVIIFTTALGADSIYYTQIWMLEYDEDSDTVIGINSSTKELAYSQTTTYVPGIVHLMYNRALDCRDTNRIDAWIRVESDKFIRLYWVDGGLNQMRSLNLAPDPFLFNTQPSTYPVNLEKIQNTPQSTIDIITTSKLYEPEITDILTGNLPNGKVCYFYRMISRDGAITTYSPTSTMVDLNAGNIYGDIDEYPETYLEYRTTADQDEREAILEVTSEKAVKIKFNNLDKNYDYIQCGYILYTESELPSIYLFPERPYSKEAGYYELVHDGLEENIFPITLEEFTQISGAFEKPKTAQAKNNWVFVANTKASQFDLKLIDPTFDTRAFSFNRAGMSYISKLDGTIEAGFNNTSFPSITQYLDSINPDYDTYKYQGDGITLGGEGSFIKYEFISSNLLSDTNFGISSSEDSGKDIKLGSPFINPTTNSNSFSDLRSPFKSTVYASHARGEKYRYGIIGVDEQGRESFVEWIADIKIPDFSIYPLSERSGQNLYVKTVGIKFDITLTETLYNYLREIKVVRVNRTEEHMTRLGTGITGSFCLYKPHKLTWSDVVDAVAGFIAEFITERITNAMLGPLDTILTVLSASTWPAIKGYLTDLIKDILVEILKPVTSLSTRYLVNADDDIMKILIRAAVEAFGNVIPIVGSVITQMVGNQVTDYIYDKIKEYIKIDVANLGESVYSLNNWNMHKDLFDGYSPSQMLKGYSCISNSDFGYVISPIHQFDKYQFRYGDKLKIVGVFDDTIDMSGRKKIVQVYHRDTKTGLFNRTHSTAAIRKWYDGMYTNGSGGDLSNRIGEERTIEHQKTMDVGEILTPAKGSGFPEGVFMNAFIGMKERYKDNDQYFVNRYFSRTPKVMGIGDKKHLIKVNSNFPESSDRGYVELDQQKYTNNVFDGITRDLYLGFGSPASTLFTEASGKSLEISLQEPRVLDAPGDYMVSYERTLSNQYGGNGFANRALNEYVEVQTIKKTEFNSTTFKVSKNIYNGDSYVGLYGAVNYNYYFEKYPGYEESIITKKGLGEIFPVEAPFNFNLREGKHFIVSQNIHDLSQTERAIKRKIRRAKRKSKRLGLDLNEAIKLIVPQRFLYDEYVYSDVYNQQKTFKKFPAKPAIDIFTTNTTNRIWRSENKIDGELIDSWRLFKPVDYIDVEGVYGPINRIITFRDKLLFYQTNAIGTVITNERSAVTDNQGSILQLATSVPFSNYSYITTESGCFHRNAVVAANNQIYHVDVNRKKIFKLGEGLEPISDVEGISGFLRDNLQGNVVNKDNPLGAFGSGIHAEYYPEHNSVFFTVINFNSLQFKTDFTINYNQILDSFESFHSFKPGLYIKTPNRLITSNHNNKGYQVFKGNYGEIFDSYVDSYITILTNGEKPFFTKTFDNITIYSEVYDSSNVNLLSETINKIECTNDYQSTGIINLTPTISAGENPNFNKIIRQERKWFLNIGRDITASANTTAESRMRDFYQLTKLSFTNNANKRFVLHDILTHYTVSQV